jgi:hypothetical protein
MRYPQISSTLPLELKIEPINSKKASGCAATLFCIWFPSNYMLFEGLSTYLAQPNLDSNHQWVIGIKEIH